VRETGEWLIREEPIPSRSRGAADAPARLRGGAIIILRSGDVWPTVAQRRMTRLYTRPRTMAVTQPKTTLNAMPSNQTLGDVKGCSVGVTEKSAIHAAQPCAAGSPGKTNELIMQMTKRTMSAAEIAHPSATMLSGLFTGVGVSMARLQKSHIKITEREDLVLDPYQRDPAAASCGATRIHRLGARGQYRLYVHCGAEASATLWGCLSGAIMIICSCNVLTDNDIRGEVEM
jgi:hypothetical protein